MLPSSIAERSAVPLLAYAACRICQHVSACGVHSRAGQIGNINEEALEARPAIAPALVPAPSTRVGVRDARLALRYPVSIEPRPAKAPALVPAPRRRRRILYARLAPCYPVSVEPRLANART